jgi:hypothetical protein
MRNPILEVTLNVLDTGPIIQEAIILITSVNQTGAVKEPVMALFRTNNAQKSINRLYGLVLE